MRDVLEHWRGILGSAAAILLLVLQILQIVLSGDILGSLAEKMALLQKLTYENGEKLDKLQH